METLFDYVTVGCFLGIAGAFFLLTAREPKTLMHFVLAGAVFAVANQLGNAGHILLAAILIIVGLAYAAVITMKAWSA